MSQQNKVTKKTTKEQDVQLGVAFMQQPAAQEKRPKAGGAGQCSIGILEVCKPDFATNLAAEKLEESDAQAEYEALSQQNEIKKTTKDQAVKYKRKRGRKHTSIVDSSSQ